MLWTLPCVASYLIPFRVIPRSTQTEKPSRCCYDLSGGGAASGPFDAMSMWELGAQTESANVLPARGKSSKRTDAECIREPR
jgi:hypothetical protein